MVLGSRIFSFPVVAELIGMFVIITFSVFSLNDSYVARTIARIFARKLICNRE